jgi:nitrite reductase (NADH) small subunit
VYMGKVSGLPPESVTEFMLAGSPYAICNVNGTIRALSGICPHQGGPLGQGQIHSGHVVCPYHMWEFDCVTGEYDYNPSTVVPTYQVEIRGDDILVQVD